MQPYYEQGGITIYHGDCREVLPTLVEDGADLVLTDPPYNVGKAYGEAVDDQRFGYQAWCQEWFAYCQRLAPRIALTPGIANLGLWYGLVPPTWVIGWWKPAAAGRCILGFNNWEPVLFWGKPRRRGCTDVVNAPTEWHRGPSGHPCPKPLRWALQLIEKLSEPGDLIVDPFMGTGTVLHAAHDLSRRAIGIEIEERYCEIAAKRLQQQPLPLEVPA